MGSTGDLIALFGILMVLAAVPGASVLLVVSRSVVHGFGHGVAATLGVMTGDLLFVLVALSGLAVAAVGLGEHSLFVRYLGGLYLIWFGISVLRGRRPERTASGVLSSRSGSFLAGLLLTLGDLKAVFFYASLFPVFVDVGRLGAADLAMLATAAVGMVGLVKLGYVLVALRVSRCVNARRGDTTVRRVAGSLSLAVGVGVILKA